MPLTRRILKVGGSLAVPIPRDLAAMMGLEAKDTVEITAGGPNILTIRKVAGGGKRP